MRQGPLHAEAIVDDLFLVRLIQNRQQPYASDRGLNDLQPEGALRTDYETMTGGTHCAICPRIRDRVIVFARPPTDCAASHMTAGCCRRSQSQPTYIQSRAEIRCRGLEPHGRPP